MSPCPLQAHFPYDLVLSAVCAVMCQFITNIITKVKFIYPFLGSIGAVARLLTVEGGIHKNTAVWIEAWPA